MPEPAGSCASWTDGLGPRVNERTIPMDRSHKLGGPVKRIGILIVAYNAASTLASVLDRIPEDFLPRVSKVMVNDDCSADPTYLVGLGYRQMHANLPLELMRHDVNLGYGGNQKARGFRAAASCARSGSIAAPAGTPRRGV